MRYLPHTENARAELLEKIGVSDTDALFSAAGVTPLQLDAFDLPNHQSEQNVEHHLSALAAKNISATDASFFVGAGAYKHHVPATVDHLIQRSEFLTSYTPYQPEISQGTLQYLFEFQSQVATLLGGEIANASLYDGSTGTGEAVLMAHRLTKRSQAILSPNLHPHYKAVVQTLSDMGGFDVVSMDADPQSLDEVAELITEETSCIVVQTPDVFGNLHDLTKLSKVAHEKGALLIGVVTEVVSLGAIRSPGEMGADIIVGEGQSIGNGLNFGGPYLGLMATRQKFVRQMPGRICGQTIDADGDRSFVLTLSTREQHIRREKATSNICTNSGLCCLAFSIHLSLLGGTGLTKLAKLNHARASETARRLSKIKGVSVLNETFFNEFSIRLPCSAAGVVDHLAKKNVLGGVPCSRLLPERNDLQDVLIVAATEMTRDEDIDALVLGIEEALSC